MYTHHVCMYIHIQILHTHHTNIDPRILVILYTRTSLSGYTFLMGNTARFLPVCHRVLKIEQGEVHEHHEPASLGNLEIRQVLRKL